MLAGWGCLCANRASHDIKAEPPSITSVAARLRRDRSAVKRDIDALLAAGLVSVETAGNPGHGTQKVVRVGLHVLID
ncbi:hypothetical protein NFI99_26425 [Burkholderia glumae]|uniref:MarR family transcriptional regulator n=1 Tax=Burkholderia glumae TaxID=337 RepID=A0ABY5BE21_BURGL|nr:MULTISPECIES: hypothetical protein [Burkholderia]USS45128.1 hypothetical protein NFI99_26425 [Burkholderia glumae]